MHRHRRRNSVSLKSPFQGIVQEVAAEETQKDAEALAETSKERDEDVAPAFELDNQMKYDLRRVKYLERFCRKAHSSIVVHVPIIKATYTLFPLNEYADGDGIFEELAEAIGRTRKQGGLGAHWSMVHMDVDIPDPEREGKSKFVTGWPVAKRMAQVKETKIPPGPISLVAQTACLSVLVVSCLLGSGAALLYL